MSINDPRQIRRTLPIAHRRQTALMHEGKGVTGSVQYCAVNKSPCGQASMTSHEGKGVTGLVQYCAVNKSP